MTWTSRRKADIDARIQAAEAAREEGRLALERTQTTASQASFWETVVARRAVDGLGVELEISFTPRRDR